MRATPGSSLGRAPDRGVRAMSSTNGHRRPRCSRRSVRRALAVGIAVATLVATALVAPGAAQTGAESTGVTAKEVKVGFIFSKAGLAGSTFENAANGFNARVKEENAKGGVNGRKIVPVIADDSGSTNNLVAAQDLVQNEKVFLVVNNSPFAFLGYRFLLDNGVPMVGGGFDGNEYGQPGNEKLISILGNNAAVYGAQYKGGFVDLMKRAGAKNVGVVAYGSSASSTAAAKNLQKYPVPDAGLNAAYTNTTVDFGTTDVGPLVLGMKNAGVDAVYLPLVLSTNLAIVQTAAQNNLKFKLAVLATGYGQALLDQPASKTIGSEVLLAQGWAPVEVKNPATKRFVSDLTKYTSYRGVPDFGVYTGYLTADLMIKGLQAAGKNLTRDGFITATKGLGTWDAAGLGCQPVDVSAQGFGTAAKTICSWYVRIKNGKFVPYPNTKPLRGTLIPASISGS
jgi:branched-chain amino acid transport system substrate-binding protein